MANKKTDYIIGLKLGLPVILGFIPVGIAYAIIARQAGFSICAVCHVFSNSDT